MLKDDIDEVIEECLDDYLEGKELDEEIDTLEEEDEESEEEEAT